MMIGLWNDKCNDDTRARTHTHTHTHIYIYIHTETLLEEIQTIYEVIDKINRI